MIKDYFCFKATWHNPKEKEYIRWPNIICMQMLYPTIRNNLIHTDRYILIFSCHCSPNKVAQNLHDEFSAGILREKSKWPMCPRFVASGNCRLTVRSPSLNLTANKTAFCEQQVMCIFVVNPFIDSGNCLFSWQQYDYITSMIHFKKVHLSWIIETEWTNYVVVWSQRSWVPSGTSRHQCLLYLVVSCEGCEPHGL